MGLLDMLFGGDGQPQQNSLPMEELRQLGLSDGLINYYQQEQAKAQKAQMWNNAINGAANIASGFQGMGARFGGGGDGGGGSSGPGANSPLGLDGLVDRALKFSQIRSQLQNQQRMNEIRKVIAADPRLTAEQKASMTPEAYMEIMQKSAAAQLGPGKIDIKYDKDNRPIAAWDEVNQRMVPSEELQQRGIQLATGMPPSTMIEMEDNLRKEVSSSPEAKLYGQAEPIFRSMVGSATSDTGASDIDFIYGIGKILDPGSVIRDNDMLVVSKSSPYAEFLQGLVSSVSGGGKLTGETRMRLLDMVQNRMVQLKMSNDEIVSGVKSRAKERGIDPSRVVPREYAPLPAVPVFSQKLNQWIPQEFTDRLRSVDIRENPEVIDDFNKRFGDGMAQRVLRIR